MTKPKPDYSAQNGEITSKEQLNEWQERCFSEMREMVVQYSRMAWDRIGGADVYLIEGWKEKLHPNDYPEPVFHVTATQPETVTPLGVPPQRGYLDSTP